MRFLLIRGDLEPADSVRRIDIKGINIIKY